MFTQTFSKERNRVLKGPLRAWRNSKPQEQSSHENRHPNKKTKQTKNCAGWRIIMLGQLFLLEVGRAFSFR